MFEKRVGPASSGKYRTYTAPKGAQSIIPARCAWKNCGYDAQGTQYDRKDMSETLVSKTSALLDLLSQNLHASLRWMLVAFRHAA